MKRRRLRPLEKRAIVVRQSFACACGCGAYLLDPERRIEWNHTIALSEGGSDTPDNIEAVMAECHKRITTQQSKRRAKVRRIKASNGLTTRRPNRRERVIARLKEREALP